MSITIMGMVLALSGTGLRASTIFDAVSGAAASAGQFDILIGTGGFLKQSNDSWQQGLPGSTTPILIGFGGTSSGGSQGFTATGPGTVYATIDYAQATANNSINNLSGTQTTNTNVSLVTTAITAATSLASYWGINGSGGATLANSAAFPTSGNITLTPGQAVLYFDITSNLNTGGTITINGTANQLVIVNVTGNSQVHFQNSINLTGGITVDNVLFNFGSSAQFGGSGANTAVINADIIALNTGNDNPDSATYAGRIFDVANGAQLILNSGLNLSGPAPLSTSTPEPATLGMLLFGASLLGIGGCVRRDHSDISTPSRHLRSRTLNLRPPYGCRRTPSAPLHCRPRLWQKRSGCHLDSRPQIPRNSIDSEPLIGNPTGKRPSQGEPSGTREAHFRTRPSVPKAVKKSKLKELLNVPNVITSNSFEENSGMRAIITIGIVGLAIATQLAAATLSFEVASVKPAQAQKGPGISVRISSDNGRVTMSNVTLKNVLTQAYKVKEHQLTVPDWMDNERYDITGKIPEGASKDQIPEMLQSLLADRFKMTLHKEAKVMPIYALVAAKGGPKLKPAEAEGRLSMMISPKGRHMEGTAPLSRLADTLSNTLDRPVIDMTELKGDFVIDLTWMPDESDGMSRKMAAMGHGGPGGPEGGEHKADAPDAPTLFVALQETMGLKLEARKAPSEIIVIDHAEKIPTEN